MGVCEQGFYPQDKESEGPSATVAAVNGTVATSPDPVVLKAADPARVVVYAYGESESVRQSERRSRNYTAALRLGRVTASYLDVTARRQRSGFRELLTAIRGGLVDVVVADAPERLAARRYADLSEYLDACAAHGVATHFTQDGDRLVPGRPGEQLMLRFYMAFVEAEDARRRSVRALRRGR